MPHVQVFKQVSQRTLLIAIALLLLCVLLFFWQLGSYSLFNITEAKQAEIARQIWVRQDWLTPIYNSEEIYFDKPILLHWLMALGYALFGLNEWAVRLPSAVAALVLILSTWGFTAVFTHQRVALLTATLLVANPLTFALGRMGQHDMLLTAFLAVALYSWYWAYSSQRTSGYLAFWGFLALAFMAKGPVALVLCALTLIPFGLWTGCWREQLRVMPWGRGLLIFAAIALPWYALVIWVNGWEFFDQAFFYNNVDRFLSPNQNQSGPWWYYLPVALIGFFPWVGLIPAALASRQASLKPGRSPQQQLSLFMAIWFFSGLIFMSFAATKLPWYIYPGFPGFAFLCAQAWEQLIRQPGRWLKPSLGVLSLIYGGLAIALAMVPRFLDDPALQDVLQTSGISHFWAVLYAIAAIGLGFSAIRQKALWAWLISLTTFSLTAFTAIQQLPQLDQRVLDGQLIPIAQILQQETCDTCPTDSVVAFGAVQPSLNFYSRLSHIPRLKEPWQVRQHLRQPQRILLVTHNPTVQAAGLDLSAYQPTYETPEFRLFIIPSEAKQEHTP